MCSAWLRTAPLELVDCQGPIRSWCNRTYGGEIEVFWGRGSPAPGSSPTTNATSTWSLRPAS